LKLIILEIRGVIAANFECSRIGAMAKSMREKVESVEILRSRPEKPCLRQQTDEGWSRIARSVEGAFCDDGLGSSSCHRCGLVAGAECSAWPEISGKAERSFGDQAEQLQHGQEL
jgi:hypothetical protein